MLPFTDTFVGPDGQDLTVHNAAYVNLQGPMEIQTNSARGAVPGGEACTVFSDPGYLPNQYAKITFTGSAGSEFLGVAVRASGVGALDGYVFFADNGLSRLKKWVGGTEFALAGAAQGFGAGDVMELWAETVPGGCLLTPYKNGVIASMGTYLDPTASTPHANGAAGLWAFNFGTTSRGTPMEVGNLVVPALPGLLFPGMVPGP